MTKHAFDPNCPDCRPCLLDVETNEKIPDSHPAVVRLRGLWDKLPRAQQEAYHRVMVFNSRAPEDIAAVSAFLESCKDRK